MSKRTMPVKPEYLRATFTGRPVGVDRENEVIRGYVIAQSGPFKSEGRGRFDDVSLQEIVQHGNAAKNGLKVRFTHPGLSSDGAGKHLGRAKNLSLGTATDARTGKTVRAVRGDLHFDPSAHKTPQHGDLADYIMSLAESDPDALSSSLVLQPRYYVNDEKGNLVELGEDDDYGDQTPLWRVKSLHASDIVDTGDAVDGLLSADQLTQALSIGLTPELASVLRWDNAVRLASQVLDGVFKDQPREVVEARVQGFVNRYLEERFGEKEVPILALPPSTPLLDARSMKMREMQLAAEKVAAKCGRKK